jgi:bacterioferritin-associated ferredoxin
MMAEMIPPRQRTVMVEKCVCHDVTFEALLQWAATRTSTTIDDVRETFGCSGSCGMCRTYIQQALATGETRIALRLQQDTDP